MLPENDPERCECWADECPRCNPSPAAIRERLREEAYEGLFG